MKNWNITQYIVQAIVLRIAIEISEILSVNFLSWVSHATHFGKWNGHFATYLVNILPGI